MSAVGRPWMALWEHALPGYTINCTGEWLQLRTEGGKFLPALGLAILMIFLVLAVQFNSFRDPFVILTEARKNGMSDSN